MGIELVYPSVIIIYLEQLDSIYGYTADLSNNFVGYNFYSIILSGCIKGTANAQNHLYHCGCAAIRLDSVDRTKMIFVPPTHR